MQAVKGANTTPEMTVRRLLASEGYRYRLHRSDLPGRPDIAFVGRRKVIFVHGCFWHGHDCRRGSRMPKTNSAYWSAKIIRNRSRDVRTRAVLSEAGWSVLTVWECETKDRAALIRRLVEFLETGN